MPRLFIAAWPSAEILDLLSALPRVDEPGVRFTTADQWHLTLRFLGDVELDEATAALTSVEAEPATATVGPVVVPLGPRVIVAPVAGLDAIAAAVREATSAIGEPVDARPFAGHITLARARSPGSCRLIGTQVAGRFVVDEIALIESELHADGARYTTRASSQLMRAGRYCE